MKLITFQNNRSGILLMIREWTITFNSGQLFYLRLSFPPHFSNQFICLLLKFTLSFEPNSFNHQLILYTRWIYRRKNV